MTRRIDFDPLAADPPASADGVRARMVALGFDSGDALLNGVVYVPASAGPHPAMRSVREVPPRTPALPRGGCRTAASATSLGEPRASATRSRRRGRPRRTP
jgi:hypothetical protein